MKSKIAVLKERYTKAKNKAELEAIDKEMSALAVQDNDAFSAAMVDLAHQTAEAATALAIREQLAPILKMVSMAYVAKTYFGKSKEWLYQRINGNLVNGKPARFTKEELRILDAALKDIGSRLSSINVSA